MLVVKNRHTTLGYTCTRNARGKDDEAGAQCESGRLKSEGLTEFISICQYIHNTKLPSISFKSHNRSPTFSGPSSIGRSYDAEER